MRSAPPIGFEYRPSRVLASAVPALTVLAAWAIVLSGVAMLPKIALMVVAIGHGTLAWWRCLRPPVRAMAWRSDGSVSMELQGRGGAQVQTSGSLADARVLGPLIVLCLRWPQGRAALWLLPDNLDADTRRRLRARLALAGTGLSVNADSP